MSKRLTGSQTEYNKLTKVILGRLDPDNTFPKNDLGMLSIIAADEGLYTNKGTLDITQAQTLIPDITSEIIEKTTRELEQLEKFFVSEKVEVLKPDQVKKNQPVITRNFSTIQFPVYCPRDVIFNFRDLVIVSPNAYQSRIHEGDYYAEILNNERLNGRTIVYAPRPQHSEGSFNLDASAEYVLNSDEPIFEAANTLIDGEHNAIYYQISHSGNEAGFQWLKNIISKLYPEVTVYPLYVYKGSHLDTTIAILDHDTVALNPERITDTQMLPEPLRNRKHIFPELINLRKPNALSSKWIGMNSLSVRPDLVIVDSDQVKYIQQLEKAGFDVYTHKLTYSDVTEGGHHCTSSDLRREENY